MKDPYKVGDLITVLAPDGRRLDGTVHEPRGRLVVVKLDEPDPQLLGSQFVEVNILRLERR